MINCPKCGAENKPTAMVCRMCATPMGAAGSPGGGQPGRADSLPPTAMFGDQNSDQPSSDSGGGDGVTCPTCQTINEVGWAFCQQCGSKLQQTAPTPPLSEMRPQQGQQTVVDQPPMREPDAPQGKPTSRPQPAIPQPPPSQGQKTVVAKPHSDEPKFPPSKPTVVDRPPNIEDDRSQGQPQPPPRSSGAPAGSGTEAVKSVQPPAAGTVPCQQCGHQNHQGSSFCAACGSPMTVASTIVMSSVAAKPKAYLHLIMEGGQPGEVYELEDETVVGRNSGDISFPHDGFMSGKHASIVRSGDSFILKDEGSRNGTFIKIKDEVELKPGDMILIGKQLFRFDV